MYLTSGNELVDQIGEINFSGNVIPETWYRNILRDNGKPNLNAIIILADIVYWYRPEVIRDENTGQIIGMKKKFKEDALQRSYAQISAKFGISEREATNAVVALEKLGLVVRDLRTIKVGNEGRRMNNVLYIHINPDRIKEITFSILDKEEKSENTPVTLESDRCHFKKGEPVTLESDSTHFKKREGVTPKSDSTHVKKGESLTLRSDTNTKNTNTKNTTENSSTESTPSINHKSNRHIVDPIILDFSEKISNRDDRWMYDAIKDNKGIPYEWLSNQDRILLAIQCMSEWNDYANDDGGNELEKAAYKIYIESIVEMLLEPEPVKYGNSTVNYSHVLKQINMLINANGGAGYGYMPLFSSQAVERFVEKEKQEKIKNPKKYMKSLIWSLFSTSINDWEGYFHRSYYGGKNE